jgi:hypothetical protein
MHIIKHNIVCTEYRRNIYFYTYMIIYDIRDGNYKWRSNFLNHYGAIPSPVTAEAGEMPSKSQHCFQSHQPMRKMRSILFQILITYSNIKSPIYFASPNSAGCFSGLGTRNCQSRCQSNHPGAANRAFHRKIITIEKHRIYVSMFFPNA